ncbi:hypothetical protein VNO80_09887 [Phaseolus coccineus]|uniref:Uncharacterized protein n=1 Tax=Phaseolus coccineus TaxID=3886 RepID=A0AAN9NDE4_PHACN
MLPCIYLLKTRPRRWCLSLSLTFAFSFRSLFHHTNFQDLKHGRFKTGIEEASVHQGRTASPRNEWAHFNCEGGQC